MTKLDWTHDGRLTMEEVIELNQALLVMGLVAAVLVLLCFLMVCFVSPHCPLNNCLPCAPKYDECDEYVRSSKPTFAERQKGVTKSEMLRLQSIQEVHQDGMKVGSGSDDGLFDDSTEEKSDSRKEKLSLMAAQAKSLKQYLSVESSAGVASGSGGQSGGQSATSDESSGESSLLHVPLKKSSVDFSMLWDKDSHTLTVEIAKLKCNFSKFAKVGNNVTMKIQLAQSSSAVQNIFAIFQKEEDLRKSLVKEAQTSVKKRKREILFNEKIDMIVATESLVDYSLRLVVCTVDKDSETENMGEAVIPLKTLESSTSYSTTMVLQPVPKEAKGEVLLSLSYLPTSEKLSVVIMQVNNVTGCKKKGQSELYVKMSIVNKGRALQKKRTDSQISNDHVQFNETHTFDLPLKHIDKTSLVLSLKETLKITWISGEDATIGKCILNSRSEDLNASGHWKEMFVNTRNPVVKWQFFR